MNKKDLIKKIEIKYFDLNDWGAILNELQDIACDNLPQKSVNRFLKASNADAQKCEDMDCILLNGQVFDWRLFDTHGEEIINAFLDYFTQEELEIIGNKL